MSVTLYGTLRSRAFRCLWMLAEASIEFDLIEVCGIYCDTLKEVGEFDGTYGCPPAG